MPCFGLLSILFLISILDFHIVHVLVMNEFQIVVWEMSYESELLSILSEMRFGTTSRFFFLKDSINFYNAINHHLVDSVTQVVWSVCDPIIHGHYDIFTIKTNALTNYATMSPKWIPAIVKLMRHGYTSTTSTIDNVTASIFMMITKEAF